MGLCRGRADDSGAGGACGTEWLPLCLPSPVLSRGREKLTVLVYADLVTLKQESRPFRQTIFIKYVDICKAFSKAPGT